MADGTYGFLGQQYPTTSVFGNTPTAYSGSGVVSPGAYSPVSSGTGNWFSNLFGEGSNLGGALSGIGGLLSGGMQAYTGFKNIGLAKDALSMAKKQFGFQKDLANRNIANQGKIINTSYDNAAQVAAGMIGSKDPLTGNYGFTSQDIIDQYAAKAKEKYVDTSPI